MTYKTYLILNLNNLNQLENSIKAEIENTVYSFYLFKFNENWIVKFNDKTSYLNNEATDFGNNLLLRKIENSLVLFMGVE